MTPSFTEVLSFVLKEEGGFVNDPDDSGGATNRGVTQKVYDSFRLLAQSSNQSVKFINDEEVYEIYFNHYWNLGKCDKMCFPLNLVHMDSCVQHGVEQANKLLQRSLDVEEDGSIGPQTRAAIDLACQNSGSAHIAAYRYILERVFFYDSLDEYHPERTRFLTKLWLRRMKHLYREIERLTSALPDKGEV